MNAELMMMSAAVSAIAGGCAIRCREELRGIDARHAAFRREQKCLQDLRESVHRRVLMDEYHCPVNNKRGEYNVELRKLAADRLRRELSSEIDPKRRILLRSEMLCGYYERHIMPWSNRLVWAVCLITWFLACVAFCEAFGIVIYPAPGMGFVGYLTGWTVAWRLRDPRRALKEDLSL